MQSTLIKATNSIVSAGALVDEKPCVVVLDESGNTLIRVLARYEKDIEQSAFVFNAVDYENGCGAKPFTNIDALLLAHSCDKGFLSSREIDCLLGITNTQVSKGAVILAVTEFENCNPEALVSLLANIRNQLKVNGLAAVTVLPVSTDFFLCGMKLGVSVLVEHSGMDKLHKELERSLLHSKRIKERRYQSCLSKECA